MKKKLFLIPLLPLIVLSGCNSGTSSIVNVTTETIVVDVNRSPSEEGGLEANEANDAVAEQSVEDAKALLTKAAEFDRYSYEVNCNVIGNESHFMAYYTPYARYENNDNKDESFGYAMTYEEHHLFKFYLNENMTEVYPSIYEYDGSNGELEKIVELYDQLSTLTSIQLLSSTMDTFEAIKVGNEYLITDAETFSIFQYMTTFGTSISSFMVGVYLEIISLENTVFKVRIDLGEYGDIVSTFTPLEATPIDFVEDKIINEGLSGIDYYDETKTFFNDLMSSNNYVLDGIYQITAAGQTVNPYYTIHCTDSYFYFEYLEQYIGDGKEYQDFGYAIIPPNTEVEYFDSNKNQLVKQTLTYESCYRFSLQEDETFLFDTFIGPIESDSLKFIQVDSLPNVENAEENVYYIVSENGVKNAYELVETTNGYEFIFVTEWYSSIADFYINSSGGTFYLSGTAINDVGPNYFEKDLNVENRYYSRDRNIYQSLGISLFSIFQYGSTTWLDYINRAYIDLNKDNSGNIVSADIGLNVYASYANSGFVNNSIYYTVRDFGNGNVATVDTFLQGVI